ncbi:DNA-3-methyladenine glycosylase [Methanolapillus ohkumae]|uniref:Putative 3-methyladenine DNA glycosylase n=1 Tax=Methanolapillus ohkumae TaxID=3028298 RepID=A0AA96ZVM2_9EURY|nr:Putative 3-methyladenine DNA glycosylase [Methanosarcinaceae archaeon Am2]
MPKKEKAENKKAENKKAENKIVADAADNSFLRLGSEFYRQDVLTVAPSLLGKILARKLPDGTVLRYRILETEAYRGMEDTACHAKAGKTKRTAVMFSDGGHAYIYLCYGIHHLLNIVTGGQENPQAALIRSVEGFDGPAKLTKAMNITKALNEIDLTKSDELWIEDDGCRPEFITTKRIGINYATEPYRSIEWRFVVQSETKI